MGFARLGMKSEIKNRGGEATSEKFLLKDSKRQCPTDNDCLRSLLSFQR